MKYTQSIDKRPPMPLPKQPQSGQNQPHAPLPALPPRNNPSSRQKQSSKQSIQLVESKKTTQRIRGKRGQDSEDLSAKKSTAHLMHILKNIFQRVF